MKLSEYVARFLATHTSGRVYGVCGAGAMHLNDAIINHPGIKFVATHHEQAATFAAEADARVSNQIGVVHVTAGPGVTNTVTGVACAWVDSIPLLVIAGQVDSRTMLNGRHSRPRQLGVSEVDAVGLMRGITKHAVTVKRAEGIRYVMEEAAYLAKDGRPGPVFVEIPLNIQAMEVDQKRMEGFVPERIPASSSIAYGVQQCVEALYQAKCPVIILGNGVHLAGAEEEASELVWWDVPILTSWNATDLFASSEPMHIGRPGLIGDRAGNFAIQNADFILAIGTRLTIPQIGHTTELFAPNAKIAMVDIDGAEISKSTLHVDIQVVADAKQFLQRLNALRRPNAACWHSWVYKCHTWKKKYPVVLPEYRDNKDGVNSYVFIEELAKQIDDDAIIVTDVGTAFVCTMQCMPMTGKQRLFHSSGIAPMGWGLPAAIGAYFASGGKRQIICICGDGGIMFNLQELETIVHHKIPVSIFVMCNDGYLTMHHTQMGHFKRESAASKVSGVSFPSMRTVARSFGISAYGVATYSQLKVGLAGVSRRFADGYSTLCEVHMPKGQILQPRVQSRLENGQFQPVDIADLWPHLPREEYERNMRAN